MSRAFLVRFFSCLIILLLFCWMIAGRFNVLAQEEQRRTASNQSVSNDEERAAPKYALQCSGCHGAGKTLPYLGGARFHTEVHGIYDASQHSKTMPNGKQAATCVDCHTIDGRMETIKPKSDPQSTINPANLAQTCARCHTQPGQSFHNSIHGGAQAKGNMAAANCADCHGSHNVFPASDERSTLSKLNTPSTCAKCHADVLADYEASSHAQALRRGPLHTTAQAPVCTTCHTGVAHNVAPTNLRAFDLQIIQQCSSCHEKQAPSYRDTFHGQATALGFKPAATCVDCHTPHHNLPPTDPHSSVNAANLVQTCGKCHQNVNARFTSYDPHPEPANRHRSPLVYASYTFMSLLFLGVFGFFGLHTLLWLQRSIVGMARGEIRRHLEGEQWVMRFAKSHRVTHIIIVVSFLALAATGLPLMYYYMGWGRFLARLLGGVGATRIIHRIFAVVTFGYAFYHLGYLLWRGLVKKDKLLSGPDSMVPRAQDLRDLYHMVRWFLYLDKKPPQLDHWTYWEKFDYFAVFWGVPIIGLSGLMLWLPRLFTAFLPGSFLNVAMIIHGEEALLATGFIFAFHFFHNHMRPENFPLDTVIFTGKLPLSRFAEERPAEYKRLQEEGRLDQILTEPPTPRARRNAAIFGYAAYIIGLILMLAIFTSFVFRF